MAPDSFRQRINQTVVKSGNAQLVAIYRRAMSGQEGFDRRLYVDALKTAGDEDRLFDALREMTLIESLELCQHWAESDRLPEDARRRQTVQRAVASYRSLGDLRFEQGPPPPSGLRGLFTVWEGESHSETLAQADGNDQDPLNRARQLYLAGRRGRVADQRIAEASKSDHWPERLVARLLRPDLAAAAADHVQWIGAISGVDAGTLEAKVLGTPVEYAQHSERLTLARKGGGAAQRSVGFLEILCAFQGAFVAGGITVEATGEATEAGALELEDAPLEDV